MRLETELFVAEGDKLVSEILDSQFTIAYLAGTSEWFDKNKARNLTRCTEIDIIDQKGLSQASFLKTPQQVVCLVNLPHYNLNIEKLKNTLSLILDNVQDPGNLGTILRIADWFGIEHVICSHDTADAFNPKVVQSTMGAICRVRVYYENINEIMTNISSSNLPMYGATLTGENIYTASLTNHGFIVMGNESKGINPSFIPLLNRQLFIPFYPEGKKRSESLNVAIATAIICSEFRRRG